MRRARRLGDWWFRTGDHAPPGDAFPWRWTLHKFIMVMVIGTAIILPLQAVGMWPT